MIVCLPLACLPPLAQQGKFRFQLLDLAHGSPTVVHAVCAAQVAFGGVALAKLQQIPCSPLEGTGFVVQETMPARTVDGGVV